jgi:tRNA threonylcarbamoyladenosine biosynthesis protein TsaE
MVVQTRRESETLALGEALGRAARPGTVVALIGDLGAGKTVFARGFAAGLEVSTRVQSPTFIILHAHEGGRLPFWHADLYRLGGADDVEQLGLDEVIEGDGAVLIEWADRFPELLPADRLDVTLEHLDVGRRITVEATGPHHAPLEQALG